MENFEIFYSFIQTISIAPLPSPLLLRSAFKVATKLNEWAIGCEQACLVLANQEPMAPNLWSNRIMKHQHGLVTDCHRLPIVPMVPIVL